MTPAERNALKFMGLGYRKGPLSELPEGSQKLIWRAGDLRARWLLNHLVEAVFVERSKPECEATATLIHAERYLADRLAYELHPWPKNMIKNESVNPLQPLCPHCQRMIIKPDKCGECKQEFCSLNCTLDHKHESEDQTNDQE